MNPHDLTTTMRYDQYPVVAPDLQQLKEKKGSRPRKKGRVVERPWE
jgi:hypothetical protein